MPILTRLVSFAARRWPFANGSGRLIDLLGGSIDLGTGRRRVRSSDGFDLDVFADDLIGRHLLLSGRFDRAVVQVLLDHARPGDVLLDVGANIGYVTACFLQNIEGSKAICVEPQPQIIDLLQGNLKQFDTRAEIHHFALSNVTEKLRFSVDNRNRGASHIDATGELVIQAVSANDFLARTDKIDLIKIDVEGHEQQVIAGMAESLARLRPRAIMFEDHTGSTHVDGAIGTILHRLGYEVFGIRKLLLNTKLIPVRRPADCRFSDYIALRGGARAI